MHWHEVLRTTAALLRRGGTTPKEEYIVDEKTQNALEQIAMEESYGIRFVGGLTPYSDADDEYDETNAEHNFPGISLREVSRMLERAYELGRNSKP